MGIPVQPSCYPFNPESIQGLNHFSFFTYWWTQSFINNLLPKDKKNLYILKLKGLYCGKRNLNSHPGIGKLIHISAHPSNTRSQGNHRSEIPSQTPSCPCSASPPDTPGHPSLARVHKFPEMWVSHQSGLRSWSQFLWVTDDITWKLGKRSWKTQVQFLKVCILMRLLYGTWYIAGANVSQVKRSEQQDINKQRQDLLGPCLLLRAFLRTSHQRMTQRWGGGLQSHSKWQSGKGLLLCGLTHPLRCLCSHPGQGRTISCVLKRLMPSFGSEPSGWVLGKGTWTAMRNHSLHYRFYATIMQGLTPKMLLLRHVLYNDEVFKWNTSLVVLPFILGLIFLLHQIKVLCKQSIDSSKGGGMGHRLPTLESHIYICKSRAPSYIH